MRGSLPTHSHTSFNLAGSIKQTNKVPDVFALSVVSGSYWLIFWVKLCDADENTRKTSVSRLPRVLGSPIPLAT